MKLKDLILIALVCVNATLAALAVGMWMGKAETAAYAATSESRVGDYIMISGPVTSSRDALLIIDVVAKRVNLYMAKAASGGVGGRWELADSRILPNDFGVGGLGGAAPAEK